MKVKEVFSDKIQVNFILDKKRLQKIIKTNSAELSAEQEKMNFSKCNLTLMHFF